MVNDVDRFGLDSLCSMEIREAREAEHAETGRVTAEAYRGLVRDQAYLSRIADVADRATRTVILVAVEEGSIVGSLTLELARRVNPNDDPLEEHLAHIRMLGVLPEAQGRGIGRALMLEAETRARARRKDRDDPAHDRAHERGPSDVRGTRVHADARRGPAGRVRLARLPQGARRVLDLIAELLLVQLRVQTADARAARRAGPARRCGRGPPRRSRRRPGSSTAGGRSRSWCGPASGARAPPARAAPTSCRARTWPRRGSGSSDPSGSRARSRAAASPRPTACTRVRPRPCRSPRAAPRSGCGCSPRARPPPAPPGLRRGVRRGGCGGSCRGTGRSPA